MVTLERRLFELQKSKMSQKIILLYKLISPAISKHKKVVALMSAKQKYPECNLYFVVYVNFFPLECLPVGVC